VDSATENRTLVTENAVLELVLNGERAHYSAEYSENTVTVSKNIEDAGTIAEGYVVTFDYGSKLKNLKETQIVNSKTPLKYPAKKDTAQYILVGWCVDEACTTLFDWSTEIAQDMTLYAKWKQMKDSYRQQTEQYIDIGKALHGEIDGTSLRNEKYFYYVADYDQTVEIDMATYRKKQYGTLSYKIESHVTVAKDGGDILFSKFIKNGEFKMNGDLDQTIQVELARGEVLIFATYFCVEHPDAGDYMISLENTIEYFAFQINVLEGEPTTGSASTNFPNGHYHEEEKILLKATVEEGYVFEGWYIGDECIGKELETWYTMPDESVEIEARYS
jgi:hypothetical protein